MFEGKEGMICMKYNICKVLMVVFTLCFLCGCDERVPSDVREVSETQNSETQSEITDSIISKADLTQRETFYLQSLVGNVDPVAFDAMWNQDFHLLTYKIYNFEDNDWHEVTNGSYKLEGKKAWIVVGTNLTELNISIGDGKSRYEKNEEINIQSLGNCLENPAILQKGRKYHNLSVCLCILSDKTDCPHDTYGSFSLSGMESRRR